MNIFALCDFHNLNFSPARFAFFAFSLFYVHLEASSLDINFSLVFHDNTSKPEASITEDVQAIITNIVQGWIQEVIQNLVRASRGGQFEESYA
jgi:hypothetical protein